jgi:predicted HicB family RNase H-like nuclease
MFTQNVVSVKALIKFQKSKVSKVKKNGKVSENKVISGINGKQNTT